MKKSIIGIVIALMFISPVLNAQWEEIDSGYDSPWIFFGNSFPPGQSNIGYVCGMHTTYNGDGVILKTEDSGETWTTILGGTDGSLDGIEGIAFTSADIGYAAGWNNTFLYTDDGGDTWTDMEVGTGVWYYNGMEFWDANNGVVIGQLNSGNAALWITDDAGETWATPTSGLNQVLFDITYADANTLYAVGNAGAIYKSTNGGFDWTSIYTSSGLLFGVDFQGTQFGIVGGEDGEMLATTNGGSSWSSFATGYENFYAAQAFEGDSAYLGGTDDHIYKTVNGGDTWTSEGNSGNGSLYKFSHTSNGNTFTSGADGNIFRKEGPFNADFYADVTTICVGETVNFTDNSAQATGWDWTFDGGTPSTSTDQNPSVVYDTPGIYDVTLTVTDGSAYDTETKYAYITVNDTPSQADTPEGEEEICTSNFYIYTTNEVDYAEGYEWELDPTEAGILTWTENEAELETDPSWTGDFTIKVRAINSCGDGAWSSEFEGTIVLSPEEYTVEGGGSYCDGGEGVEVTLSGSNEGVDYELMLDGESTGNIVEGTGSSISFGLQTEEGYYSVEANNGSCESVMVEQVAVIVVYSPFEPGLPEGPETVCSSDTTTYTTTGSDGADAYTWSLIPEEAGTLEADDMSANVVWSSDYSGTATISVFGYNDCGEGNPSELEVLVETAGLPKIEGEPLVCANHFEDYSVTENDGSTYTWTIIGGTITEGEGTYMITVEWGEPGEGSINVTEETANGCEGVADEFIVEIDDCTGMNAGSLLEEVKLYPNPVKNEVNLSLLVSEGERYTTSIYNTLGQQVYRSEEIGTGSQQTLNISMSKLPGGLYIVQITTNESLLWKGKLEKTQ